MNDTIAAISTALGVGAVSIIRLSGTDAVAIANKIFKGNDLTKVKSHTINYGHIIDKEEIVDEVLVSVMLSPKTYTKEDIIEINCHGGINTTNRVLSLVLSNGARLAEPGEFTKRAFLNGRIDLVEAEGVMDLINAKTEKMRKLAINQVEGKISRLVKLLRDNIRDILINIDVNIDYPEYEDILVITNNMIKESIAKIKTEAHKILKESENSKIIKEGIKTTIIGRPNVGKSSLLNKLIDEDKAIVTDTPGTTRDIVEGIVNIDGIILNVIDTAGIRQTEDKIEQIGVNKSMKTLDEADFVILVLNNNEEINEDDLKLLEKTKNMKRIIYINKNDLASNLDKSKLQDEIIIYGNTVTEEGIDALKDKIRELFGIDELEQADLMYLSNARQIGLLNESVNLIEDIEAGLTNNVPVDIIAIDLKKIYELLGEIIGENYSDELIDELFRQFCLGK
ncbi:MAG TPA: tRNA uridine-5-carboxymethylaminomethyl(34) synthesis GTPase MnmE [Mollicutes bacterium]|jgi:tRNA modification GTPase|nr:tRNA uridine-5-carboxymethylaminomethyl(34) synthesis GTPase MnmE [Mollicutes bacterium]